MIVEKKVRALFLKVDYKNDRVKGWLSCMTLFWDFQMAKNQSLEMPKKSLVVLARILGEVV